jgi:hypothetical protein
MNKPFTTQVLRLFLLLTIAISITAAIYITSFKEDAPPVALQPPAAPQTPPPDLQMLAAQMVNGVAAPTPEQVEEDARVEKEQVETAAAWLQDADSKQRVAGAEQLAAYPTPEAEKLLAETLGSDLTPEVRAAAAQSLDSFKKLQESTIRVLMDALEDPDEDVRLGALNTLQSRYARLDGVKPVEAKNILASLKKKAKSPQVPLETQQIIVDFLHDLE